MTVLCPKTQESKSLKVPVNQGTQQHLVEKSDLPRREDNQMTQEH